MCIKADFTVLVPFVTAVYTLPPFISPYSVLLNKKYFSIHGSLIYQSCTH